MRYRIFLAIGIILTAIFCYWQLSKPQVITVERELPSYYITQSIAETMEPPSEPFKPLDLPLDAELQDYINYRCERRGMPKELIYALIWQESRYQANIISTTGDYGLMQINKCNHETVKEILGVTDILDPYQNCKAGIWIYANLYDIYGSYEMALIAYNKGQSGAKQLFDNGIYSNGFSQSVMEKMNEIKGEY